MVFSLIKPVSMNPLYTDTPIIRTFWRVPLVSTVVRITVSQLINAVSISIRNLSHQSISTVFILKILMQSGRSGA